MGLQQICDMLMWCTIINFGVLLLWSGMFLCGAGWIYRLHSKLFPMSREAFNMAHYSGMGLYKLAILVFNVVPYIALLIVG